MNYLRGIRAFRREANHSEKKYMPTTYDGIIRDQGGQLYDVKSSAYGAVGNGTTDDTSAIQSAINAAATAGGGTVFLPQGHYLVSSLTIDTTGVSLVGEGNGCTSLLASTATDDILYVGEDVNNIRVTNLAFGAGSGVSRTGGYAVHLQAVQYVLLADLLIQSQYNGIKMEGNASGGSSIIYLERLYLNSFSSAGGDGIYITGASATTAGVDYYLNHVNIYGGTTQPNAGIHIDLSGATWISNSDIETCNYGLLVDPSTSGWAVNWTFAMNVSFDQCTTDGISINPSSGAGVDGFNMTGCWTSSCSNNGISISGNNLVSGCRFVNHRVLQNGSHGVYVQDAINVYFDACDIGGNSKTSHGTYNGVSFGSGVTHFGVSNSRIGNVDGEASTQDNAIFIQSGNDYAIIVGNDLTGNTAEISGSCTHQQVANNL